MSKRGVPITVKEYPNDVTVKERMRYTKSATVRNTLRGFIDEIACYIGAVSCADYG